MKRLVDSALLSVALDRQLSVSIPGKPVSWMRPGGRRHRYTEGPHSLWKQKAVGFFRPAWKRTGRSPIRDACLVEITATWNRPKKWTSRRDGGTMGFPSEREWALMLGVDSVSGIVPAHTVRQDLDNIAKIALDALESAGVLSNDHFVTDLIVRKRWNSSSNSGESVLVSVYRPLVRGL